MLSVRDGVGDQFVRVGHAGGFGEIDHGVRVVLLVAGVGVGEQRVDAVDTCEDDAGGGGEDVSAADELGRGRGEMM